MRSLAVLAAGFTLATFALGARAAENPTPPELAVVQEQATPGDHFTDRSSGTLQGTVKGATGNVLTLDVGQKAPLVQIVLKDEDAVPIHQEGGQRALAFEQLREGTPVRTHFRNEGGVRVATTIEVLAPEKERDR
jgi:hypothetical protein